MSLLPDCPPVASASLQLGSCALDGPFVQAALSGYSDWPMRALARRFGASYSIAEVMLDRFVNEVRGTGTTRHYLHVEEGDHPVGAQLMGSDPAQFETAARRLAAAGFDVIDINFGCPVRTALGGCRGGYHLGQPDRALEIISRVRDCLPPEIPVTVKMRRGIDDSDVSRENFFRILSGAFERGVAAATVHARTVVQKYQGPSNWSFLKEVKAVAGEHVILGSGDLFTPQRCLDMLRSTGVDGVTIARGSIGNPWIFRQANELLAGRPLPPPPSILEQREVLQLHRSLAEHVYGERRWLGPLRKFGFKYARLHPQLDDLRRAWSTCRGPADWDAILTQFYGTDGPGIVPEVDEVTEEAS